MKNELPSHGLHECPSCNWQCHCDTQPCKCCNPDIMDLICPFCNDIGFDKIGLKYHLEKYCKQYLKNTNDEIRNLENQLE